VLIEIIAGHRHTLIQTLLDFCHAEIGRRTQDKFACRQLNIYKTAERPLCDSLVLGGLFRAQKRLKRDPLPEQADKVLESANDMMIAFSAMFKSLLCLDDSHKECNPAKRYAAFEAKTRAGERWKSVLRPDHKQRMARQRKMLGILDH
jgi:hypothetical protein